MLYLSFYFYIFVVILLLLYYVIPLKYRWVILLAGSLGFYYILSPEVWWMFALTILITYGMGLGIERIQGKRKKQLFLIGSLVITVAPLIMSKNGEFVLGIFSRSWNYSWIVPIGLSFYTLQMISYLVDVYHGKIETQKNLGKYALFVSFFPQIVQGPIPRYEQLGHQLYEGHRLDEREFSKGLQLIVWGFFLKLMIADKAGIIVDTVFGNTAAYQGGYVWVAGILYSIQLYADFQACVCLAKGVSQMFGIHLEDNFRHPYMAQSVKEFWGRWHMSLSSWLRDYIYIPLGGNRKGRLRKYLNIMLTFTVSGIWHGTGYKYIFWGWMHGAYQVGGEITAKLHNRIYEFLGMSEGRRVRIWLRRLGTFFWVMAAWIIFRADSLREGIFMLRNMVTVYNPWIFLDDSLFGIGLSMKEWCVLAASVLVLAKVSILQEGGRVCLRDRILSQPLIARWVLYITAVVVIMVFGTYGYGFEASDFIYGGF